MLLIWLTLCSRLFYRLPGKMLPVRCKMGLFMMVVHLLFMGACTSEFEGPGFTTEPPERILFSNSSGATVPCTGSGRPVPTITWRTANGDTVKDIDGIRRLRADGTLSFLPFSSERYRADVHSTEYRCVAQNSIGAIISRSVHIRAVLPRHHKIRLSDEFLSKGNTAVLRCPHDVDGARVRFWERSDGFRITENVEGGKYGLLENGDLYILDANERDNKDSFKCYTENKVTKEQKTSVNSAKVIVSEPLMNRPPRIVHSSKKVVIIANQKATISCIAHGHPIPVYRWTKLNGQRLAALDFGVRVRQEGGILRFHRALITDSGKYSCYVNNGVGEDKAEVEIVVKEPLSVMITPALMEADVGDSVEFRCSITPGVPEARVTWLKNAQVLLPDKNHVMLLGPTVLRLSHVDRKDEGMFQCFVGLEAESAQAISRLVIRDVPPKMRNTFPGKTVTTGITVSLTCSATGSPRPIIEWTLDNIWLLSNRPGHSIRNEVGHGGEVVSTLNISSVDVSDSGVYSCTASSDAGVDVHSRRLNVFGPLFSREVNKNVTTLAGSNLTIACPFGGYPFDSVVWKKESEDLPVNSRQTVHPNGLLSIEHIQPDEDDGRYYCHVSSGQGLPPVSGSLTVVVRTGPVVSPFDFRSDLREGMRTAITCVVSAGDKPYTIEWTKDGMPLRDGVLDAAIHYPENGFVSTLSIEKLAYRHNGEYACRATNDVATGSHSSTLTVKVPARWISKPSNSSVIAGQPARIDCQAEGVPQPHVRWKKAQGDSVQSSRTIVSSSNMHVLVNGSLNFQKVQLSDAGLYVCEANNGIGSPLNHAIYISVHSAPQILSSFSSLTARRGQRAQITCTSRGDSPLSFTWTKNGQSLDMDSSDSRYSGEIEESLEDRTATATLVISKADRQDNVHFTCMASNEYGRDSTNIQLTVQDIPDAPQNVEVHDVSSRSVRLSWKPPFDGNSPVTQYTVAWRQVREHTSDSTLMVSGRDTSYMVRGLRPATRYFFRVKCDNALGPSQYSAEVAATTLQEPPVAAPILLKPIAISTQSIQVSWKNSPNEQESTVEGFYVGYKVRSSPDPYTLLPVATKASDVATTQSSTLFNLKRYTEYTIVVRAFNNRGAGPPSQEFNIMTLEFDRPEPPLIKIQTVTFTSIKVSWVLRDSDSTPTSGCILFHRTGDGVWQETSVPSNKNSHSLQRLLCGTTYYIYAIAYNGAGRSNSSNVINTKTAGNPPIAPEKHSFIDVNSTCLSIHLDSWKSNGCPITSFALWYRKSNDHGAEYRLVDDERTTGIMTLKDLQPGSWYKLKVTATNDAGKTKADYDFATLTLTGEYPPVPTEMRVNEGGLSNPHLTVTFPLVGLALLLIAVALSAACLVTRRRLTRTPNNPDSAEASGVSKQEQLPLSVTYDGNQEANYIGSAYSTADVYQQNYLNRERSDSRHWTNKMDAESLDNSGVLSQQRHDFTYTATYRATENYSPYRKPAEYCPIYHHRDIISVKQEAIYEVPDRGRKQLRQYRRDRNESNEVTNEEISEHRQCSWQRAEDTRDECRESETECDRLCSKMKFENAVSEVS